MDEVRLRSDSIVARRIAASFLDFLRSVEVVDGVDPEGLEVAAQCLTQIFDLERSGDEVSKVSLIDLVERSSNQKPESKVQTPSEPLDSQNVYRRFIDGLESAGYFSPGSSGEDLSSQAESTFQETLKAYKGKDESELLAEAFKAQGNSAIANLRYVEAIELYTLAISMSGNNAIYFANRAAAHTQAGNHAAAITDCHKAIEINPRYSKAYSRLGLVYYSQDRYLDAVEWFTRALEVDPSNRSASENLQSARQKLVEAVCGSSQEDGECFVNVNAQFESNGGDESNPEAPSASDQDRDQGDQARETPSEQPRAEFQADGIPSLLRGVLQGLGGGGGLGNVVPEVMQAFGGIPEGGASATFDLSEALQSAIRNMASPSQQQPQQR